MKFSIQICRKCGEVVTGFSCPCLWMQQHEDQYWASLLGRFVRYSFYGPKPKLTPMDFL